MTLPEARLTRWFPEVYASRETKSLLNRILLAAGRELATAEEDLIILLTSHWVDFATEESLDRLASCLALSRRTVVAGTKHEDDTSFRVRLKDAIPFFTGGGTVKAIAGAMRWALGLPINLDRFREEVERTKACTGDQLSGLIEDIEGLIRIEEFPPCAGSAEAMSRATDDRRCAATVVLSGGPSDRPVYPRIEWTLLHGVCHGLEIRFGDAVTLRFKDDFIIRVGDGPLILSSQGKEHRIGIELPQGVHPSGDPINGSHPALPTVPTEHSEWIFSACGGAFDYACFDDPDGFDIPSEFRVDITWVSYPPLSFDVIIPFFIAPVLETIKERRNFQGTLQPFTDLSRDDFQGVVDQVRAAGVRGMVQRSLAFEEDHEVEDSSGGSCSSFALLEHRHMESAEMDDSALNPEGVLIWEEEQHIGEGLILGGVFDVAPFDGIHGFQADTE